MKFKTSPEEEKGAKPARPGEDEVADDILAGGEGAAAVREVVHQEEGQGAWVAACRGGLLWLCITKMDLENSFGLTFIVFKKNQL